MVARAPRVTGPDDVGAACETAGAAATAAAPADAATTDAIGFMKSERDRWPGFLACWVNLDGRPGPAFLQQPEQPENSVRQRQNARQHSANRPRTASGRLGAAEGLRRAPFNARACRRQFRADLRCAAVHSDAV